MQFYEDLEVGAVARFGNYAVTREEVLEFARRYDPQPFHLDDAAAATTAFGKIAASGWHTCSMFMAMLVAHQDSLGHQGTGSPGVDELRWLKPVHPGDTLRCEQEIIDKRESKSRPEIGIFRTRIALFNQHDEPVMRMIGTAMVRRRAAA